VKQSMHAPRDMLCNVQSLTKGNASLRLTQRLKIPHPCYAPPAVVQIPFRGTLPALIHRSMKEQRERKQGERCLLGCSSDRGTFRKSSSLLILVVPIPLALCHRCLLLVYLRLRLLLLLFFLALLLLACLSNDALYTPFGLKVNNLHTFLLRAIGLVLGTIGLAAQWGFGMLSAITLALLRAVVSSSHVGYC